MADVNPYTPPPEAADLPRAPAHTYGSGAFEPSGGKATAAIVLLYIALGTDALSAVLAGLLLASGASVEAPDSSAALVIVYGVSGILQLLVLIGCAIAFCIWFHRVYKNLPALGVPTTFSAGWAPGSFFVPILNLFRPFQIAKEIWVGSDSGSTDTGPVTLWWALYLGSNIIGSVGARIEGVPSLVLLLGSDVLSIAAALAAVRMINGIEERQASKHRGGVG